MLVDMATQPLSTDLNNQHILDFQLPAVQHLAGSTALAAPSTIKS